LLILTMTVLMVSLDVTIVNLALPSIGRELHASVSGLQWVIDAYTLVLASTLMVSGALADRFGRRKILMSGQLLFISGSFLCSLAPNIGSLVAFRGVQALGGSMLTPIAMSIIVNTFTDLRERAQAIGVWAAVAGLSGAFGPLLGGALVTSAGWRSVFWINVPIGLVAVVLASLYVPESRAAIPRRLDLVGQLLLVLLVAPLTYGIIEGPNQHWTSPGILAAFGLAGISLVAFIAWERRHTSPVIDLRFFHSIPFSGAIVMAIVSVGALGSFLFLNTLYLQEVRDFSALKAGVITIPMAVTSIISAALSGAIVGRRGARPALIVSGLGLGLGSLFFVGLTNTTPLLWLFCGYIVFGVGSGFVTPPVTQTTVSGMPRAQAGVAASITSTSRFIGQTLGVAVVGSLVAVTGAGTLHSQFASASHVAWWMLTGCGLVVLVLGVVTTSKRAMETAARTALELNPEMIAPLESALPASVAVTDERDKSPTL
jgi:EmrB/QacA subfamily drug resistance transporter